MSRLLVTGGAGFIGANFVQYWLESRTLNGLPSVTRYSVIRPLYDGAGSSYRARYRAQFDSATQASPPRWRILPTPSLEAREPELLVHTITRFPEAAVLLGAHDRLAGKSEEWLIYE